LTVGESFFFRNEFHFRALRKEVLPTVFRENAERREVRVWSAGCATGEEPYSLAILLEQLFAEQSIFDPPWSVSILGTDLNPTYLRRAREARYRTWSFRNTQIHRDPRLFCAEEEFYRLNSRLSRQVHFLYLNLVKDVYPSPLNGTLGLDLILFRNVAIYLKPEVTAAVVQRLYQSLRPGGWLLPGETEVSFIEKDLFEVHRFEQATFLRKPSAGSTHWQTQVPFALLPIQAFQGFLATSPVDELPPKPAMISRPRLRGFPDSLSPTPGMLGRAAPVASRAVAVPTERPSDTCDIEALLAGGRFLEAGRRIDRITDLGLRVDLRIRQAQALLASAETHQAREVLETCCKEQPLSLEAYLLHAGIVDEAGDLETAERGYRRALYIDRNCAIVHFLLASVRRRQGDYVGAIQCLDNTLKLLDGKDSEEPVEYGDGICCGRLRAMVEAALEF
jgi:chemotaxis protein methyltransferase CheR